MRYVIKEADNFSVIGQEIELTNSQRKNVQISTQFWCTFNINLKKLSIFQSGNWLKYAFMERRNGKLFYYCAVPKKNIIPEGFTLKQIKAHKYIVVEHVGAMNKIYETYGKLYQEILPNTGYRPAQDDFLHFERYDQRFYWNNTNSIIEIWLPIMD